MSSALRMMKMMRSPSVIVSVALFFAFFKMRHFWEIFEHCGNVCERNFTESYMLSVVRVLPMNSTLRDSVSSVITTQNVVFVLLIANNQIITFVVSWYCKWPFTLHSTWAKIQSLAQSQYFVKNQAAQVSGHFSSTK